MKFKIINNQLKLGYGVDVIESSLFFRKIKISDLKDSVDRECKVQEDNDAVNLIQIESIGNPTSINSILFGDNAKEKISDENILNHTSAVGESEAKRIETLKIEDSTKKLLEKIQQQINTISKDSTPENVSVNLVEYIDVDDGQNVGLENVDMIESKEVDEYYDKVKRFFMGKNDSPNVKSAIDVLFKYKDAVDLTRFDIGNIAWNINVLFSSYFQGLFKDLKEGEIVTLNIESFDEFEKKVIERVQRGQSLEIYQMFKFVCRILENNKKNLISQLKNQSSKDSFNILKGYLDYEAYGGNIKGHFYMVTLDQLRRFRNYQAHNNDESNIEKIIKTSNPDKMKGKFYSKFLGDLSFDGTGFLQFIMNKENGI